MSAAESLHRKRIDAVINHLHSHPDRSFDLEELAALAHYSNFHFHRVFQHYTKQTPGQYVRNQRLDRAARILVYNPRAKIIDVAEACGFSSSANFTKVFKPTFGISPREIRGNSRYLQRHDAYTQDNSFTQKMRNNIVAEAINFARRQATDNNSDVDQFGVSLRRFPDFRVAFYRTTGPYSYTVLEDEFERMVQWLYANSVMPALLGVPRSLPSLTPSERCQHDVCGILPEGVSPGPDMSEQILSGGEAAVFQCEIDNEWLYFGCRSVWNWLTNYWLPESDYQPDDRPAFERYLRHPHDDLAHGKSFIEFCLPVRPLSDSLTWA